MTSPADGLYAALVQRGMSRRSFLRFSAAMAAALALPAAYAPRIAAAVAAAPRVPVIWLRGQACAGNTQAFLRASKPTVAELLLDHLSVEYQDTLMASSGAAADLSRTDTMARHLDGYIAIIEGSIPTADGGTHCMIGGRPFQDIVREVSEGALATIAVGSCAFDGGLAAASGGSTGAVGAGQIASGSPLVSLPGCPLNVDNLVATIVHYLTFKSFPVTDSRNRPLFAYGGLIHNQCERRAHFEFGEFVLAWGDEGAQKGWCLYKMGCKGPETFANCPTQKYAEGMTWPVKAGHGCIGCTMPRFWDANSPFYRRLPEPVPFLPNVTVDQVGQALVGGVAAVTAVHGAASYVRQRRVGAAERREAALALAVDAPPERPVAGLVPPILRHVVKPASDEPPAEGGSDGDPVPVTVAPASTPEAPTSKPGPVAGMD